MEYHLGRVFAAVDRPYDLGNVIVSAGSSIVQGIGTNWISTFEGRAFYCDGAQKVHHVSRVVNGQFLVLDTPYAGSSNKFAGYSIRPSDTESRLVYYSEPDLPEAWPSWNAFAVPDHGDEITGLMVFKSYLYIIERRHISQFTFKGVPGRDGFIFLKSHRGCISNRCYSIVEDAVYMLDESGVHRFDGDNSTHISAKSQQYLQRSDLSLYIGLGVIQCFTLAFGTRPGRRKRQMVCRLRWKAKVDSCALL